MAFSWLHQERSEVSPDPFRRTARSRTPNLPRTHRRELGGRRRRARLPSTSTAFVSDRSTTTWPLWLAANGCTTASVAMSDVASPGLAGSKSGLNVPLRSPPHSRSGLWTTAPLSPSSPHALTARAARTTPAQAARTVFERSDNTRAECPIWRTGATLEAVVALRHRLTGEIVCGTSPRQ